MADKLPPVDGMEYPEKPEGDVSKMEIMQWMEQVDHYWGKRGSQKPIRKNRTSSSSGGDLHSTLLIPWVRRTISAG